jgi:hypothetical protein
MRRAAHSPATRSIAPLGALGLSVLSSVAMAESAPAARSLPPASYPIAPGPPSPPNAWQGYPPPMPGPALRRPPEPAAAHLSETFYFQLRFGLGYLELDPSRGGTALSVSGGSVLGGVACGAAVARNLIVFGETFISWAPDAITGSEEAGGGVYTYGIGPGVAYYFMPIDIFVSATVAATKTRFFEPVHLNPPSQNFTDWGLGVRARVGKEWRRTEWGIGIAVELAGALGDAIGFTDLSWTAIETNLLVSVTYN